MVPEVALSLARRFEGLYLTAYRCPAGVFTIGYGHTRGVRAGDVIIEAQADAYLSSDMIDAINGALRCCPTLILDMDRLGAVADFVFNLGESRLKISTLRKKINAGNWIAADRELQKWVWGGGRKLPGLILRRAAEGVILKK